MKNFIKILAVVLLTCILIGCVSACDTKKNDKEKNDEQAESTVGSETVTDTDSESESESDEGDSVEFIDYVGQLKLDMTSSTLKQEVTVKSFIDGDTTHFYVPTSLMGTGVIKARYLAINTPESTGKIEEWGKAGLFLEGFHSCSPSFSVSFLEGTRRIAREPAMAAIRMKLSPRVS